MNATEIECRATVINVSTSDFAPSKSRCLPYIKFPDPGAAPRIAGARPWDVAALCEAYAWPTKLTGGGVIAIVELGGGWIRSDVELFCKNNKIPVPSITDISVDGTRNSPGVDPDSDGEVALDVQVTAAAYSVATGKPATIRVYWANDIAVAVRAATADGCDVCSISWGSDEANWGKAAAQDMEQAAAAACAAGMIVFAAAGDNDSSDGGVNATNVDLPAGCPHVIGCGGTRKTTTSEIVWNANPGKASGEGTGGGFSTFFEPVPLWQIGAPHGPGRVVPDVAANADPVTGYKVVLNGEVSPVGGTSAVAPLYAGLFAAFGAKLGWVTPELWSHPVCFNDINVGDNGAFRARVGPDACTGLGSPIGGRLAALMMKPGAAHARQLMSLREENASLRQALTAARAA
jgi:subtilase family serine protease